jgi:hypothetical protein
MQYTTGRGLGIACNTLRMLVLFGWGSFFFVVFGEVSLVFICFYVYQLNDFKRKSI